MDQMDNFSNKSILEVNLLQKNNYKTINNNVRDAKQN